jgi:hypothetical protein
MAETEVKKTDAAKKEFNITQKFLANKESKRKLGQSDSGLIRYYSNDVTAELDTCLQGQAGAIAFRRMSMSDSIVGGILRSYENPIQSAKWSIDEISDVTPKELEVIKVLNEWFFKRNDFGTLLSQILGMLPIGFSLFEKYYTPVHFDEGKFMMPILAERVQQSIRRIDYKDQYAEQFATSGGLIQIPFDDLVFFTFRQSGNDKRGTSLLRQAYYDFLSKKEIKKAGTKGIIRAMIGLVLGTVPKEVNSESQMFEDFNELILDLGERDYNGLSDSAIKQEGYEIEILNSSFDLKAMKEYIAYLDSSMTMSVLTQFITLGQSGGGGSYSLGRDGSDMLLDGLGFIISYIEKNFSQKVIHETVAMNFPDVDPLKFNLVGNNLNKKNSKEFADTLKVLIDSGIIKYEVEDEVKIRKMYDLPEINMKEREAEDDMENSEEESQDVEDMGDQTESEDIADIEEEKEDVKSKEIIKLSENWKTGSERKTYKKQETEKLTKFTKASLQLIADEFSKTVRRQLNKGAVEAQGLKDLKINNVGAYKKRLGQKLAGISSQSWKNALKNSQKKIKLSEISPSDLPTNVLSSFVINLSDTIAEKQLSDLRDIAILTANTNATKGLPVNNNMAMVDSKMDDYINNANKIDGGNELATVQSMNYGELQYYKSIENDLWGYRFANDMPETDICKSLVGKTYPLDSAELDIIQPPLHYRCDSFLVPIYKSEEAKPQFDNYVPAPSILKQKTI